MNLTFQILDGGQPYLVPLAGTTGTIGSSDDCAIRLTEDGVEPEHARFEPLADGSIRLVDLGHGDPVVVNGEEVVQWRLQVGDRIEIGRAVLVVGQQVERKATAADVLNRGESDSTKYVRPRPLSDRGSMRAKRSPASIWIPAAGALVIAAVIYLVSGSGDPASERPREAPRLESEIRRGDVVAAAERIERLRDEWAGDDAARKSFLDKQQRRVDELARLRGDFEQQVRDNLADSPSAQRKRIERAVAGLSRDDPKAVAARAVLSDLASIIDQARRDGAGRRRPDGLAVVPERPVGEGETGSGGESIDYTPTFGGSGRSSTNVPDAAADDPAVISEVRYALRGNNFALAETLLVQALNDLGEGAQATSVRGRLDQELASVRAAAVTHAGELLERGRDVKGSDGLGAIETALQDLQTDAAMLTASARTAELDSLVLDLERRRQVGLALERADDPVLALAAARDLVQQGAFDAAQEAYEALGQRFADAHPLRAEEARGRKSDTAHIASLWQFVEAQGAVVELQGRHGESCSLPGDGPASLFDVEGSAWVDFADKKRLPPAARVGAGLLAYSAGDPASGDRLLHDAEKAERGLETSIHATLARLRGEAADEGYRFIKGRYVSEREFRLEQRVRELERGLANVLRAPAAKRDEKLEKLIGEDEDAVDVLVLALRRRAETMATELEGHEFLEDLDKVGERYTQLLEARKHGLALIFDEVKYFYPYRPPAVSGERYQEYRVVQEEVDRRVEVVRELYEETKGALAIPKNLRTTVERFDWVLRALAGFGEVVPGVAARTAWVRRLPNGPKITLQNYAPDAETADDLRRAAAIRAFNQTLFGEMSDTEVALVTLTNDYRVLMGRLPYAAHMKLMESSRGHADEMAELGYFSHFSPTTGRRSPGDRMRLAGYRSGIGENLARHSSAESAMFGWRHSSGHHRNLLHRSCTEIGVAQTGRLWAQNFGGGRDFEGAEAFAEAMKSDSKARSTPRKPR